MLKFLYNSSVIDDFRRWILDLKDCGRWKKEARERRRQVVVVHVKPIDEQQPNPIVMYEISLIFMILDQLNS